ncbi:type III secretion protein [Samsonia erythrinae]|uniref:Type III secretion protein n=1 Tax=Samsonia erythrinae TaxID=160434 RepID=A0A4R3VNF3_9GAMM|nr:type III secretion protein [Samsonia erythrinae]TCV05757.1 hypothetical protein EDC54_10523 [Samsonia erythrinae]
MTAQEDTLIRDADNGTLLAWVIWWAEGCLLQADPSWQEEQAALPDAPLRRSWLHVNAVRLNRRFSLPLAPPPAPLTSLMQLGALDGAQREKLLRLMARVCQPVREQHRADEEDKWCERLAKALRPGLWLPAQMTFSGPSPETRIQTALMLLRLRYGEACWPRLRLLFPRDRATRCPAPTTSLPVSRLTALCDAVIWKASALA